MPADATAAQSEASRRNAALSTGPVTAAGKAASARNAVRHGLRGSAIEVLPEESAWLASLQESLAARWRPADETEESLVQALAVLELKLARLDALELRALTGEAAEDGPKLPSLNTLVRYRSRLLKERWETDHRLRSAIRQRCTNEAEAKAAALAQGRDRQALDERWHALEERAKAQLEAEDAAQPAPALNRQQRRRLEAHLRRAA
jgi:hypothetical protein